MRNVASRPRRTVASYDDYPQAERAVDYLSDHGFPVEHVAIVGHGLRYVVVVDEEFADRAAELLRGLDRPPQSTVYRSAAR